MIIEFIELMFTKFNKKRAHNRLLNRLTLLDFKKVKNSLINKLIKKLFLNSNVLTTDLTNGDMLFGKVMLTAFLILLGVIVESIFHFYNYNKILFLVILLQLLFSTIVGITALMLQLKNSKIFMANVEQDRKTVNYVLCCCILLNSFSTILGVAMFTYDLVRNMLYGDSWSYLVADLFVLAGILLVNLNTKGMACWLNEIQKSKLMSN